MFLSFISNLFSILLFIYLIFFSFKQILQKSLFFIEYHQSLISAFYIIVVFFCNFIGNYLFNFQKLPLFEQKVLGLQVINFADFLFLYTLQYFLIFLFFCLIFSILFISFLIIKQNLYLMNFIISTSLGKQLVFTSFFIIFLIILSGIGYAVDPSLIDPSNGSSNSKVIIAADPKDLSSKEKSEIAECVDIVIPKAVEALLNNSEKQLLSNIFAQHVLSSKILGELSVNADGSSSKQLLHVIQLIKTNNFLFFIRDLCSNEKLWVLRSENDLVKLLLDKDGVKGFLNKILIIYKTKQGPWAFYNIDDKGPFLANQALSDFLESSEFQAVVNWEQHPTIGFSYFKVELGDGLFKDILTGELKTVEFKTHIYDPFLERRFLKDFKEIKPHLNAQILYSKAKTVFQRSAFGVPISEIKPNVYTTNFFTSQELKEQTYQAFSSRRLHLNNIHNFTQKLVFIKNNDFILPIFKFLK